MRQSMDFHGKILLFGEYALMVSSMALGVPFVGFSARLSFPESFITRTQQASNASLVKFFTYLESAGLLLDYPQMQLDLSRGLYFASNIKSGYGMGSSGALVAAVYRRYNMYPNIGLSELKAVFSKMESFFHGSSSGLDPLICYNGRPTLFISKDEIKTADISKNGPAIFLADSKISARTAPLIECFFEKLKSKEFSLAFEEVFVRATNKGIDALISGSGDELYSAVKQISAFTLNNLREMIPYSLAGIWKKGLETDDFYLKLCGSGGGGYALGFTRNIEMAKTALSGFEITIPDI